MSASQICHRACGSPPVPDAVAHPAEPCAICGGPSTSGIPIADFIGPTMTDQTSFRAPHAAYACAACAFVRARIASVPGREPKECDRCDGTGIEPEPAAGTKVMKRPKRKPGEVCEKCDGSKLKESGGRWSNFSHFADGPRYENASKGEKPRILQWLRGPKSADWFCVVADSGQKHLLPYAPINPAGARGRIRFEEQEVALPRPGGWRIVDELCALLTGGVTKEEVETGRYTARAYELCGDGVRAFEAAWGHLRGGAWFSLVVWLSQRDEEQAAERMAAEVEAKKEKKTNGKAGRKGSRAAADAAGRDAPRVPQGVPADVASEGAGALADPAGPDAGGGAQLEKRGRVGDADSAVAADPAAGQLDLFAAARTVDVRPRARRVGGGAKADRS